jgi:hypothetical protein
MFSPEISEIFFTARWLSGWIGLAMWAICIPLIWAASAAEGHRTVADLDGSQLILPQCEKKNKPLIDTHS